MISADAKGKVAIIDYGIGNLYSVQKACEKAGINSFITANIDEVMQSTAIILPGVGAFGSAMNNLQKHGHDEAIRTFAHSGRYILGICLGMQLLMDESEEFGVHKGLGIIEGTCKKFTGETLRVPQINWNTIYPPQSANQFNTNSPLANTNPQEHMYFVHSYYVCPKYSNNILSVTNYEGFEYCSAVVKDNIFGVQFHPEKSGEPGLNIYKAFRKIIYG